MSLSEVIIWVFLGAIFFKFIEDQKHNQAQDFKEMRERAMQSYERNIQLCGSPRCLRKDFIFD